MKSFLILGATIASLASLPALASADLAQKKNCMACHATDKKLIGPGYKEVAAKYAGQKDAADKHQPGTLTSAGSTGQVDRRGPRGHDPRWDRRYPGVWPRPYTRVAVTPITAARSSMVSDASHASAAWATSR